MSNYYRQALVLCTSSGAAALTDTVVKGGGGHTGRSQPQQSLVPPGQWHNWPYVEETEVQVLFTCDRT